MRPRELRDGDDGPLVAVNCEIDEGRSSTLSVIGLH